MAAPTKSTQTWHLSRFHSPSRGTTDLLCLSSLLSFLHPAGPHWLVWQLQPTPPWEALVNTDCALDLGVHRKAQPGLEGLAVLPPSPTIRIHSMPSCQRPFPLVYTPTEMVPHPGQPFPIHLPPLHPTMTYSSTHSPIHHPSNVKCRAPFQLLVSHWLTRHLWTLLLCSSRAGVTQILTK